MNGQSLFAVQVNRLAIHFLVLLLSKFLLDMLKGKFLPNFGILIQVEVIQDRPHATEDLPEITQVQTVLSWCLAEEDLGICMQLIVVMLDGLLV